MNRFWKITICILLPFVVTAQQNPIRFDHLTDELENLGIITKIIQDKQGYFWLSTLQNGIYKFDGYTVKKYSYHPFDPSSIPQNQVYNFIIDKNDTLWIGTTEGICKFDRRTEKFIRYNSSLVPGMPDLRNVSALNEDDNGNIWIGNFEGRIWRYNKKTRQFLSLTSRLNYKMTKSLASDFHEATYCIFKDRKGSIWIGNSNGLHKVTNPGNLKDIKFTHYQNIPGDPNSLSNDVVFNIYEDNDGVIWVLTAFGLNSFHPVTGRFTRYLPDPQKPNTISTGYLNGWGTTMAEDRNGNLWIATPAGLNRLNKERSAFNSYYENESDEFGLRSSIIHSLGIDKGTTLLVANDKGLQTINLKQKPFGLLQNDPKNVNSISNNDILSILEDHRGIVWIGTTGGGLNKWDKATNSFIHYKNERPNSLKRNIISDLIEYPAGKIYICNGEFLSCLNTATNTFEHFNSNIRDLKDADAKNLNCISHDKDGLLWIGTGNGIKSFDTATKKFTHYFFNPANAEGISDYTVMGIFCDSRENIWICNNSIAFDKFNKKTGKFTHYTNNTFDQTSISSNIAYCVYEDSKGKLWIGTYGGGLCQYNYKADNFVTVTRNKELPWHSVFSIQQDQAGNLWLGTDKGISRYNISQSNFTNYDVRDGLQGDEFAGGWRNKGSSSKGKNGQLYFGGRNGVNYFDPAQIQPNSFIPPIVITEFKIFDKVQPGQNEKNEIELKYNQNFFSFEFAALSYTNTSKNKYAYRLEGFDDDWVYCGTRRYAGYTNLDPGEYTFKVIGSNNDGVWNKTGASIKLTILPPWWRTNIAYLTYGLLIVAIILSVHRYQKQKVIRAEREKAQKKELEQAKEIEKAYHALKATQQQLIQSEKMASLGELTAGIAHEIQNPLNFVNNFSEVSNEMLDEMKEKLASGNMIQATEMVADLQKNLDKILHHGKRADSIVKGMLQHSRASSGRKEPVDINALADEYLRLSYHGMRAKDKSFHATIQTSYDESIGKIQIIPQDMGRVLLNLYNNAFYAVAEKAKTGIPGYEPTVILQTKNGKDKILLSVKDNGNGIHDKIIDKIFQPFFTTKPTGEGTGLGLSLAFDIVTKGHNGELKVVTHNGQLAGHTQNDAGTEFLIMLPKLQFSIPA